MAKNSWLVGKSVVITGAGSGIGKCITKILIQEYSCTVIGIGRSKDKLVSLQKELAGLSNLFSYRVFDVSNESCWNEFAKELVFTDNHIDVLINNAGVLHSFLKANDLQLADIESAMNTNFYGAIYGMRSLWNILQKSTTASIINISSSASLCALAGISAYSASKAALRSFTESMQGEYKDMYISFVCPGLTKTAIFRNQATSGKDKRVNMLSMDVEKMANKIVNGIRKHKKRMVIGLDAKFMDSLYRLCPKLSRKIINGILKSSKVDLYQNVFK